MNAGLIWLLFGFFVLYWIGRLFVKIIRVLLFIAIGMAVVGCIFLGPISLLGLLIIPTWFFLKPQPRDDSSVETWDEPAKTMRGPKNVAHDDQEHSS